MIHYVDELLTTDSLRESMKEGGDSLAFSANEVGGNEFVNNCAKWHWHSFVEFVIVLEGILECCTPKGSLTVFPGEGYFINANVLHLNRMAAGSGRARYRVIQFETGILTGAQTIGTKYVAPLEGCAGLELIRLSAGGEREGRILDAVQAMFELARTEPELYELRIMQQIVAAWLNLFLLAEPQLRAEPAVADVVSSRVKQMLAFIHAHYAESVNTDDIAGAASISRREAFRCFRRILDTTPMLYLMQYRVNRGVRLLMEGGKTITEVSMECGFSSPGYFCKAFHDLTGISPRDFRKQARGAGPGRPLESGHAAM